MNKNIIGLLLCGLFIFPLGAQEKIESFNEYNFTGPYTHKNLSVYLIAGKDKIANTNFLTLQEALEKKTAVVHETEDVNRLQVSNNSRNYNIFIIAGDIVKGGKQDRAIQYNYIVPPKTDKLSIACFCVESGRWQRRGGEDVSSFRSSNDIVASKDLKMSVKKEKSQEKVWGKVSEMQDKLGSNLGGSVKGRSESSLQLTLEHEKIKKAEGEYEKQLKNIPDGKADIVGYAFVINGKINSAEVFAAKVLFQKLWPKLIKASIVEAIAEYNEKQNFTTPDAAQIKNFMAESEKGKNTAVNRVSGNVDVVEKETDGTIMFETRDKKAGGQWLNKSYIKK